MRKRVTCYTCKTRFYKRVSEIKRYAHHFCNLKCVAAFNAVQLRRRVKLTCSECKKEFLRIKSEHKRATQLGKKHTFCNRSCANTFIGRGRCGEKHPLFSSGKSSYRERAFRKYGTNCANVQCEYHTSLLHKKLMDVHHIDGSRENNALANLIVLCSLCHAKITRGFARVINRVFIECAGSSVVSEQSLDKR